MAAVHFSYLIIVLMGLLSPSVSHNPLTFPHSPSPMVSLKECPHLLAKQNRRLMQKKKKKPPRVLYGPFSGRLLLLFLQNLGEID